METDNNNPANNFATEEDREQAFDFWSDEGARRFNEMIEEGSAYLAANPHLAEIVGEDFDGEECEYLDPDLYAPDEEILSPGEMEIILESCYIN
jgi:hypothetical protein